MRDEAGARLRRYLRVAYDGGGEPELPERAPNRWAAPSGAAARVAALLVVLVVAALTYLVLARIPPAPAAPEAPAAEPSAPVVPEPSLASGGEPPGASEQSPSSGVIVVHVAGAVVDPGLVEVAAGTRVAEAIERAGGSTEDADLDALNLAAPVADGQQVYVPRQGEAVPPAAAGTDSPDSGSGLVNVNTADAAALETLPGIGPALADRILSWRSENGPFPSVDALTNVSGIGPATLARLRDLVTV